MDSRYLIETLKKLNVDFFTGVPDSYLSSFVDCAIDSCKEYADHIIAANEGNAVAFAAGYHLATGKIPCIYLQNSGLGNIINPVTSLLNEQVYQIPCVFVIGWRGEPGVVDEPQHRFQGDITLKTLELLDIEYIIIDKSSTVIQLEKQIEKFKKTLEVGKSVAFVVKKGALTSDLKVEYKNDYSTRREDVIKSIVEVAGEDPIVATTGKTSRELFEIREANGQPHHYDFLTVGSMGHSSSIALGIALNKPAKRVWCLDGDGSTLMHLGSMATIGALAPKNFVHILINNESHESVGGQPTVAGKIDFMKIAEGCGYSYVFRADNLRELNGLLENIMGLEGPIFIEVKCAIGSRNNLGRPSTTPVENKQVFMDMLTRSNA
ncbi:MAG: phosphonopyruvate decarboxylase [Bacteroidales bacterium]|nr:phosphonopyruvate decarboxylase [Bacteroidales bacterium]